MAVGSAVTSVRREGKIKVGAAKPHDLIVIDGVIREVSIPPGRITIDGIEYVQLWFKDIEGLRNRHYYLPNTNVSVSRGMS